ARATAGDTLALTMGRRAGLRAGGRRVVRLDRRPGRVVFAAAGLDPLTRRYAAIDSDGPWLRDGRNFTVRTCQRELEARTPSIDGRYCLPSLVPSSSCCQ